MFESKILIVDDEDDIREFSIRRLKKEGFKNVFDASTPILALEIIKREKPDFILLDVNLKAEIDGIEILKRTKEGLSELSRVVMCSAQDHRDACMALGALEFWKKPMSLEETISGIKRILSSK